MSKMNSIGSNVFKVINGSQPFDLTTLETSTTTCTINSAIMYRDFIDIKITPTSANGSASFPLPFGIKIMDILGIATTAPGGVAGVVGTIKNKTNTIGTISFDKDAAVNTCADIAVLNPAYGSFQSTTADLVLSGDTASKGIIFRIKYVPLF